MKNCSTLRFVGAVFLLLSFTAHGQNYDVDLSVQVQATVQTNPAQITLDWKADPTATSHYIYRKLKTDITWGSPLATLGGTDSTYTDASVTIGENYEYRIFKTGNLDGYGYINAGIQVPAVDNKGGMIVVVDDNFTTSLNNEIDQLVDDLEADSWMVTRIDLTPADDVASVKMAIQNVYTQNTNTAAVLLLGHVPVPYSGLMNPDGHPDHIGAWPADVFYGEMDGTWTDNTVSDQTATQSRNHNVPGDGKYDQSDLPNNAELQVGRIDFFDLPAFTDTEEDLLRNYLQKLHDYKTVQWTAPDRGLVDEGNFSNFDEGFAQNGWKNFVPMFGKDEVYELDYQSTLATDAYMWSYGCGGGTYTSANSVINTSEFASQNTQTVFTMLFGSYFGDWDTQDNLLRSSLASGTTLTASWAGRPNWQYHHMALGENIGYSGLLSQNNPGLYEVSTLPLFSRWTHIALLGDPSLRMHYPEMPSNLTLLNNLNHAELSWTGSTGSGILGYNIYRRTPADDQWTRINNTIVSNTMYTDSTLAAADDYIYMVRAVELKTTFSGSYFNQSLGITAEDYFNVSIAEQTEVDQWCIFPNPTNGTFELISNQQGFTDVEVQVINLAGEMINARREVSSNGNIRFDLSAEPKGIYLLQVLEREQTTVKRVVLY